MGLDSYKKVLHYGEENAIENYWKRFPVKKDMISDGLKNVLYVQDRLVNLRENHPFQKKIKDLKKQINKLALVSAQKGPEKEEIRITCNIEDAIENLQRSDPYLREIKDLEEHTYNLIEAGLQKELGLEGVPFKEWPADTVESYEQGTPFDDPRNQALQRLLSREIFPKYSRIEKFLDKLDIQFPL